MITTTTAAAVVLKHFSGLRNFPETPEAQDALIDALRTHAHNDAHAQRIGLAWAKKSPFSPTYYDLMATATEEYIAPEAVGCTVCGGSGWKPSRQRIIDSETYSSVEKCPCRPHDAQVAAVGVSTKKARRDGRAGVKPGAAGLNARHVAFGGQRQYS